MKHLEQRVAIADLLRKLAPPTAGEFPGEPHNPSGRCRGLSGVGVGAPRVTHHVQS